MCIEGSSRLEWKVKGEQHWKQAGLYVCRCGKERSVGMEGR